MIYNTLPTGLLPVLRYSQTHRTVCPNTVSEHKSLQFVSTGTAVLLKRPPPFIYGKVHANTFESYLYFLLVHHVMLSPAFHSSSNTENIWTTMLHLLCCSYNLITYLPTSACATHITKRIFEYSQPFKMGFLLGFKKL